MQAVPLGMQGMPRGMQGVPLGMQGVPLDMQGAGCRPTGGPDDHECGCSITTSHVGYQRHTERLFTHSQVSIIQNVTSKHINAAQQHQNTWCASVHAAYQGFQLYAA